MMPYSTEAEIQNQVTETTLIELTDDAETGTINTTVITQAIQGADGVVDLHCRSRYTVPFTTVDAVIQKISMDLAIHTLYCRRQGPPPWIEKRYAAALLQLKAIQEGIFRLDITEVGPASSLTEGTYIQPQFTRGKFDEDGNIIGNVMGYEDEEEGSLDDW